MLLMSLATATTEQRRVRWGIMGTGAIASDFVRALQALPDAEVAAVGSRTHERATAFAAELHVEAATLHATYEELAADGSIDIVYVATPSSRHVSDSTMCLRAGRAVLCEKSMAPTAAEAASVLELARERGLFFGHGVWSRFFPAMAEIRRLIASGAIGNVRSVHASFCQNDGAGSCSAMAETGVYCAQFLLWAFGGAAPRIVGVQHQLHPETGHDVHVAALLAWPCGGMGSFECSLQHASPRTATICGTKGVIEVPYPFWCPTTLSIQTMTGAGMLTNPPGDPLHALRHGCSQRCAHGAVASQHPQLPFLTCAMREAQGSVE
jgi:dihydrodiol dehydrogenase / D-xylose 1-dehydrogenase (NADP)